MTRNASAQDLPNSWVETTFGDISEYITSGSRDWSKYYSDHGALFIRTQDINTNRLRLDDIARVALPEKVEGKRTRVFKGDILITITGANVGKVALVENDMEEAYVSQSVALVRLKDKRVGKFLHYQLTTKFSGDKTHLEGAAYGLGRPVLNLDNIRNVPIRIAPLDQQKRIVAEIEKQFSRLDEAVANLKRVKANLKRYKAAVLKAAVEGKLTEKWRKQHPDVAPASKLLERILVERRNKWEEAELAKMNANGKMPKDDKWKEQYKEPAPIDLKKLPELPGNWEWTRIEKLGFVQLGRQRAPKYHSGPNIKPYLRVQNVFEDRIDLDDVMEMNFPPEDYRKYKLMPGDILLNEGQSPEFLGRPAIFRGDHPDVCFTNTLIRFRVYQPLLPEYSLLVFRAYMRSGRFTAEGTITTNIAHLSAGRFAQIEYPLPPLEEQAEIVKEAERKLSIINMLDGELDKGARRAERLRQSILSKAFSGKLN